MPLPLLSFHSAGLVGKASWLLGTPSPSMSGDWTTTARVSTADNPAASVTRSSKVRVAVPVAMLGAVKLALADVGFDSVTEVPPVCRHW